jgi:hypothetical protein
VNVGTGPFRSKVPTMSYPSSASFPGSHRCVFLLNVGNDDFLTVLAANASTDATNSKRRHKIIAATVIMDIAEEEDVFAIFMILACLILE